MDIEDLNKTINQLDPTDIYRARDLITAENIFSNAHGVLTKIDHTLVIKQNLLNVKELK